MKFLIIHRSVGVDHGIAPSAENAERFASEVQAALDRGVIEAAYALVSGGVAYVTNASDTEDLTLKVRENPLFRSSSTEVIPVADAVDFLRYAKQHVHLHDART